MVQHRFISLLSSLGRCSQVLADQCPVDTCTAERQYGIVSVLDGSNESRGQGGSRCADAALESASPPLAHNAYDTNVPAAFRNKHCRCYAVEKLAQKPVQT